MYVNNFKDTNDDYNGYEHIVPFNLAYAISIHKAQGLEYNSVKIIITSNIEEQITKNIFYTAITRAKKDLKIFWSHETENKIFENMKKMASYRVYLIVRIKIWHYLSCKKCKRIFYLKKSIKIIDFFLFCGIIDIPDF